MKNKLAVHQQAVRMSASRQTSDREELIAKKENLLVPDYRSRQPIWELCYSPTKVAVSVESDVSISGAVTNTSRVMNEPITSIPKNNRLLWKYISSN